MANDLPGSRQTIQAVAWLGMIYEDSGITAERANEAATLIQVYVIVSFSLTLLTSQLDPVLNFEKLFANIFKRKMAIIIGDLEIGEFTQGRIIFLLFDLSGEPALGGLNISGFREFVQQRRIR